MKRFETTMILAMVAALLGGTPARGESGHGEKEHEHAAENGAVANAPEHGHDDAHGDNHISRNGLDLDAVGLVSGVAGAVSLRKSISLPGEIVPNAERVAHIVPRYAGIVTSVEARLGEKVKKGQILAVIEADESLATYKVRTLIPGTVIAKHVVLGEAASREQEMYVIADLSTVWVDLAVYQRDLMSVDVGQSVTISASGQGQTITGVIDYVSPVIDEVSRTASARVVLPNREGRWMPGLFVTGEVEVLATTVECGIPLTALFELDGEEVVFVETADGFVAREVKTGRRDSRNAEIVTGLEVGERFVRQGGFSLLAELRKSDFGEGHSH